MPPSHTNLVIPPSPPYGPSGPFSRFLASLTHTAALLRPLPLYERPLNVKYFYFDWCRDKDPIVILFTIRIRMPFFIVNSR